MFLDGSAKCLELLLGLLQLLFGGRAVFQIRHITGIADLFPGSKVILQSSPRLLGCLRS